MNINQAGKKERGPPRDDIKTLEVYGVKTNNGPDDESYIRAHRFLHDFCGFVRLRMDENMDIKYLHAGIPENGQFFLELEHGIHGKIGGGAFRLISMFNGVRKELERGCINSVFKKTGTNGESGLFEIFASGVAVENWEFACRIGNHLIPQIA